MFRRMIRDIRKADGGDHDVVEEADRLRQSWAVLFGTCSATLSQNLQLQNISSNQTER
jgi:hypothetical protein